MKALLTTLATVLSISACLAQTYAPDLDLSKAKTVEIIKVAQSDAKDFYQQHKADNEALSDASIYASGRAIKHGITSTDQDIEYEHAFLSVLKQMELDKE